MKVLFVTWTIYDERLKEFSSNCTGGGLVIKNLCNYVGKIVESYLFIGRYRFPEIKLDNFTIIDTLNKVSDSGCVSHLEIMNYLFRKTIEELRPDVVNVHGNGDFSQSCIKMCLGLNVPVVYTSHLYIGQERVIDKYNRNVQWEKQLFSIPRLNIIAVSSGMKNKIISDFPGIKSNIVAIKNGTDFRAETIPSSIIERFKLYNKKILLCVGTIMVRKNQLQLVRAFQLLDSDLKNNIAIIFCGNDRQEGQLQRKISENNLQDSLIYVGSLSSEDMKKYYSICDGLIMPSLAEGLSIAALETIAYGQPVIIFRDSECAEDLNDDKVCVFADNRADQTLANAIEKWYFTDWSVEYIKKYSEYFSMERMANEYVEYYTSLLKNKN